MSTTGAADITNGAEFVGWVAGNIYNKKMQQQLLNVALTMIKPMKFIK